MPHQVSSPRLAHAPQDKKGQLIVGQDSAGIIDSIPRSSNFALVIIAVFSKNERYSIITCSSNNFAVEAFSNIHYTPSSSSSRRHPLPNRTSMHHTFRHGTGSSKASTYNRVNTNSLVPNDDNDSFHNEEHSSALILRSTPSDVEEEEQSNSTEDKSTTQS